MLSANDGPQSALGAIAKIVGSGMLLALIVALRNASGTEVAWDGEAFLRGCFMGLVFVLVDYHRVPPDRRLAPLPAMVIGLGSLGVILVALQRAPRPVAEFGWIGWLAVLLMAAAPLSLVAGGMRGVRRGCGVVG